MSNTSRIKIGITLLRIALAFVFLWFGFSQLSDTSMWTAFVPQWAINITGLSAGLLVLINGLLEIIAGSLLAFGIFTRIIAILLGIHLFMIALSVGFTAIGVRDIGLSLATITLGFLGGGMFTMTENLEGKTEVISNS